MVYRWCIDGVWMVYEECMAEGCPILKNFTGSKNDTVLALQVFTRLL